jgi:hypothetical protein
MAPARRRINCAAMTLPVAKIMPNRLRMMADLPTI